MSPTYSFGEDSPLKFEISDKLAKHYNEAVAEFLKAQQRFNQKFGRQWNPESDPIALRWTRQQRKAWNDFAKVLAKNNYEYLPNDIMDDFLVKNAVSAVADRASGWGWGLSIASAGGALYGLLRGR